MNIDALKKEVDSLSGVEAKIVLKFIMETINEYDGRGQKVSFDLNYLSRALIEVKYAVEETAKKRKLDI